MTSVSLVIRLVAFMATVAFVGGGVAFISSVSVVICIVVFVATVAPVALVNMIAGRQWPQCVPLFDS